MTTFYSDIEPFAVEWLGNLMDAGLIPQGTVDDRDIRDIQAADLAGVRRAHFFAGIGGWELALQLAGWPEDAEVWTGSCPCQPFSAAGKGMGNDDERHLWPDFRALIATCFPMTIFGEQVASADGRQWLEEVRFDCEHIIYWHAFEKGLHKLREAETHEVLSQILGAITGRVEAIVRLLSEEIRSAVAEEEQAKTDGSEKSSRRQRSGVQAKKHRKKPCEVSIDQDSPSMRATRLALRFRRLRGAIEQETKSWRLRDDWTAPSDGSRTEGVEQPEPGQDQSESWLHIQQCSGGLFRNECGAGRLGGEGARTDSYRLVGEENVGDIRRIAERYRAIIASSVARLRNAGILTELDSLGYAVGAADLCGASIGAPHIRQRLFWGARLADTGSGKIQRRGESGIVREEAGGAKGEGDQRERGRDAAGGGCEADGLADRNGERFSRRAEPDGCSHECREQASRRADSGGCGGDGGMADSEMREQRRPRECREGDGRRELQDRGHGTDSGMGDADLRELPLSQEQPARQERPPIAGAGWSDFDLIPCLDGKSRRVESGTFPLAHGLPRGVDDQLARLFALAGMAGDVRELRSSLKQAKRNRVGQLKGYGNAIVPQLAAEFVRAFMET